MHSVSLFGLFSLVLLCHSELVERGWDSVCFDLGANGGSGPGNEETNCRIYAWNNGYTTSEKGIENRWISDCIPLHDPSRWSYTYIWTTCGDALWIDQMRVATSGWCTTEKSENRCQVYGADNQLGWCLSTDKSDGEDSWKKYTPAGCFKMFRLGKPGLQDSRVFGYDYSPAGRRSLSAQENVLEQLTQRVRKCEETTGRSCEEEASKVFEVLDHLPSEGWVTQGTGQDVEELDEHCYPVVDDYENEVRTLQKHIFDLQSKLQEDEYADSVKKPVRSLESRLHGEGRRSRL